MKIVYTYTHNGAFIHIPIEVRSNYPQIIYAVASQCLFPSRVAVPVAQSKRVPIQKTK